MAAGTPVGNRAGKGVVGTIVGQGEKDLADIWITVSRKHGKSSLVHVTATSGHTFYLPEINSWVKAGELQAGDRLDVIGKDLTAIVRSVQRYVATARVYNLVVATMHTYYVVVGGVPVLVHNGEDDLCRLTLGPESKAEGISAARGDKVLPHEQRFVNESGDRNGCHSCGAKVSGWSDEHWTGDHFPARSISPRGPWTLYPHCRACTLSQGGYVRGLGKGIYEFPPG
ncbi:polymorphic toxin-type HINT domain-containing protein [Kribbella sp. NBC_00382]|uniref:polymorphic toxin-type HINT domain-containing protein n=1 Tax=Kribbella sp. NBC_00382 TaxID=2975967 RepID=UPI003FA606DB